MALLVVVGVVAGCGGRDRALPADRGAPVLYVALGDSTVEGVGASRPELNYVSRLHDRLRTVYPGARVRNLGVGGATSADVLRAQVAPAIALGPQLVTLSVGPNDITQNVPLSVYERHLDAILGRLTRETEAVVVLNLLPDLGVTPRFRDGPRRAIVARLTEELNDVIRRKGREYRAALVDLYGPSREEVPRRPELMADDGYHPSDAGYARWAELMWQGIAPRAVR